MDELTSQTLQRILNLQHPPSRLLALQSISPSIPPCVCCSMVPTVVILYFEQLKICSSVNVLNIRLPVSFCSFWRYLKHGPVLLPGVYDEVITQIFLRKLVAKAKLGILITYSFCFMHFMLCLLPCTMWLKFSSTREKKQQKKHFNLQAHEDSSFRNNVSKQ